MRAEPNIRNNEELAWIDPRSVPRTHAKWAAAFRLKPAKIPGTEPFAFFGQHSEESLTALKNLTSPAARHLSQKVMLQTGIPVGASKSVLSAFASSLPEWRFVARGTPHMVLASTVGGAVAVATEIYGQFMRDTGQKSSMLSFVVERFHLAGTFADVCDSETFISCYDDKENQVPQHLVDALASSDEDGLIYDAGAGLAAVILNPAAITSASNERALALEWNGERFYRVYDYRDMYWRDLEL